jgi:peptidoglycan hydrolase CwlO-like protein
MKRLVIFAALLALMPHGAMAQDVPGIEICTAEKTMERRTGCLQSNVNFLKSSLTKASLESQQKIDAANRQIDALKAAVTGLQKTVADLQGQVQALGKKPNGAAAKEPAAK